MIYQNIGRRERGKTTLAYYMARKLRKRVLIDARQMVQRVDVERVRHAAELPDALHDMTIDDALNEVVFQPADDDLAVAFESFVASVKTLVVNHPKLPVAVLVDEVSFYNLESARFQWLAKCTPRETVHLILTAHRPADIPTSIRAIADHWCIFSTTQEHDLKVIEQRTGSPSVVKAIKRLEGRQYVHWDDARGVMNVQNDPKVWYTSLRNSDAPVSVPKLVESNPAEWELES